ncbi:hypothetical protein [Streptomyces sp. NRRL S-244]|uniref:hypothetical protein n=1 Tax=Streptomyces sp. NRRL S-244 TaxID=1463897 RepID=UPI0004C2006E|nr:hypothetical protein [Streptomyces sp. NRRL S-244]
MLRFSFSFQTAHIGGKHGEYTPARQRFYGFQVFSDPREFRNNLLGIQARRLDCSIIHILKRSNELAKFIESYSLKLRNLCILRVRPSMRPRHIASQGRYLFIVYQ